MGLSATLLLLSTRKVTCGCKRKSPELLSDVLQAVEHLQPDREQEAECGGRGKVESE